MKNIYKIIIITIAVIIIIAAIIYLFFILDPNPYSNWKTYENARYNFSLKYPDDWELGEQETTNAGREFFSPDQKIQCYAYGFQNALMTSDGDPQSLEEFITWLKQDPDFELIKQDWAKLDNYKAIELVSKQNNKIKNAVYVLGEDTGRGVFCIFNNQEALNNFKKTFNQIIESFKIKRSI